MEKQTRSPSDDASQRPKWVDDWAGVGIAFVLVLVLIALMLLLLGCG